MKGEKGAEGGGIEDSNESQQDQTSFNQSFVANAILTNDQQPNVVYTTYTQQFA